MRELGHLEILWIQRPLASDLMVFLYMCEVGRSGAWWIRRPLVSLSWLSPYVRGRAFKALMNLTPSHPCLWWHIFMCDVGCSEILWSKRPFIFTMITYLYDIWGRAFRGLMNPMPFQIHLRWHFVIICEVGRSGVSWFRRAPTFTLMVLLNTWEVRHLEA
jgi:hypothetical protein